MLKMTITAGHHRRSFDVHPSKLECLGEPLETCRETVGDRNFQVIFDRDNIVYVLNWRYKK